MTDAVFAADPARLLIAAAAGILLLLLLIIKFKFHPVLSLLISALVIGLGAGMPVPTTGRYGGKGSRRDTAGNCITDRSGIIVRRHPGSIRRGTVRSPDAGEPVRKEKGGIALGITGLVVGTTVFFEAGVVILIPLAFGLAKKTKKSTLYYVIPLLAGLATGFAFSAVCRIGTGGEYAWCRSWCDDRSRCSDRNPVPDLCRNSVVQIHRNEYTYRTSGNSVRGERRKRSQSSKVLNRNCDYSGSAGIDFVQYTF